MEKIDSKKLARHLYMSVTSDNFLHYDIWMYACQTGIDEMLKIAEQQGVVLKEFEPPTREEKLTEIAKKLAAMANMAYCWEDVLQRLKRGDQLPFNFKE